MSAADRSEGNPLLRYFGMETPGKARKVFVWAMPYTLILAAALAGFSYLVHWFQPLPVWVHAAAILLAVIYFYFFLARVREANRRAGEEDPAAEE